MANPFRGTQQKPSARRRRLRLVALLTVPALIGGASLAGCGSGGKKSVQLVLEAVGEIGAFPFVEHPDTDLRGVRSAVRGGGERAGDARGAFGGLQGATHCDKASLIKQLTDDPEKARAWAEVKNIDEGRIGEYINGLTETYLEFDTLVKNHDFRDGEASEYLSVLQKGVLVLTDNFTAPAVKCNCGNPLQEPDQVVDTKAASYTGTRWESFATTEVTVIKARTKEQGPVKQIPLVDPFQGDKAFDRGVGSDGSKDSKPFHWDPPKTPAGSPGSSNPKESKDPKDQGSPSKPPKDKSSEPSAGSSGVDSSGSGSSGPGSSSSGSVDPSGRSSAQGVRPTTEPPVPPRPGASSKKPSAGSTTPVSPRTTPPRTSAPVPSATRPVAPPTAPKPVTPTSSKPEAPTKPVAPTPHKPVAPTAEKPERPVAPTAEKPEKPVKPPAEKPERPVAPTAEKPEKPVAPTAGHADPPKAATGSS
ncbi:hypothetical protein IPZ58_36405 [Streptomyces roseoverticillatus]|uniref:DUF6777 domain-containing protein n=1 Tax=Streptomyces roseoverticillatus TaxID=66429 RepID=UPI001F41619B|nr:DUF6777 domain-containing protein [Streptomyces roseoverticillatus]MCF3106998.1 hypothetical protein [Streptomyces roseoverticillatus]